MSDKGQSNMNRRHFLKTAGVLAGGVMVLGSCRTWQGAQGSAKAARWALLSDTHIPADAQDNYRGFYPYQNLQKVVPQITRDLPEGLVITGDPSH